MLIPPFYKVYRLSDYCRKYSLIYYGNNKEEAEAIAKAFAANPFNIAVYLTITDKDGNTSKIVYKKFMEE